MNRKINFLSKPAIYSHPGVPMTNFSTFKMFLKMVATPMHMLGLLMQILFVVLIFTNGFMTALGFWAAYLAIGNIAYHCMSEASKEKMAVKELNRLMAIGEA
jgi:hypothetical protein